MYSAIFIHMYMLYTCIEILQLHVPGAAPDLVSLTYAAHDVITAKVYVCVCVC